MTTPTDDRPELLTVIAFAKAAPGKEDELRAALQALVAPTQAEKGYVNYDLHESLGEPGVFYLYENWESGSDLDVHLSSPHLEDFKAKMSDLLDDTGLTVTRLRRMAA